MLPPLTRYDAVNVGVYGLSTYLLTRQFVPSANPLVAALALGSIYAIHVVAEQNIWKHFGSKPTLRNFYFSLISVVRELSHYLLVQYSPLQLSPFGETVAIGRIAHSTAEVFKRIARITFAQQNNPGWKGIINLWNTPPLQAQQPTTGTNAPPSEESWSEATLQTGVAALIAHYCTPYLFKSADRVTTTFLATLIFLLDRVIILSLFRYFDTSKIQQLPEKESSMLYLHGLLGRCAYVVTSLTLPHLGQLFPNKTPSYFDTLAVRHISAMAAICLTRGLKVGYSYLSPTNLSQ
jgi:hypothetical protein